MGDKNRFKVFAEYIATQLPRDCRIADVAGGTGELQQELRRLGFTWVTSWDNRHLKARVRDMVYVRRYFDYTRVSPKHYDAVVGLHPDGGTDQIVMYAVTYGKPGILCPCCVVPTATRYQGGLSWLVRTLEVLGVAEPLQGG